MPKSRKLLQYRILFQQLLPEEPPITSVFASLNFAVNLT